MSIDHWPSAITMGLQSAESQSEMSPFLVQAHPPDRLTKCGTHQVEELGIDLLLHVEVAEDQEMLGQLGRVVDVVHDKLHQVHHALPVPLELSVQRQVLNAALLEGVKILENVWIDFEHVDKECFAHGGHVLEEDTVPGGNDDTLLSGGKGQLHGQALLSSLIAALHDTRDHLEHLHPRVLDLCSPHSVLQQDGTDSVAENRSHDVEITRDDARVLVEHSDAEELGADQVQVVYVNDHLVDNVHHQLGVVLQHSLHGCIIVRVHPAGVRYHGLEVLPHVGNQIEEVNNALHSHLTETLQAMKSQLSRLTVCI